LCCFRVCLYIGRMKCKLLFLLAILWAGTSAASSQSNSIVGTWTLTAADKLLPNGIRTSDYGENPHGLVIFTADGHYTVEIYRADRKKFSSSDRLRGTPDEYRQAFLGMSAHFGRYTVDAHMRTISFIIDRASFPNWDNATQVRSYELRGDELSWKVPARPDGSVPITVLRRVR